MLGKVVADSTLPEAGGLAGLGDPSAGRYPAQDLEKAPASLGIDPGVVAGVAHGACRRHPLAGPRIGSRGRRRQASCKTMVSGKEIPHGSNRDQQLLAELEQSELERDSWERRARSPELQAHEYQRSCESMSRSRSWRFTLPLRKAAGPVRRLRSGLRGMIGRD